MTTRFLTNVNLIFLTQAVNRVLAFFISIAIARGLGPEARGDFALFVLSITLAATLGSLGAGLGTTYFVSKERYDTRVLVGNSHFLLLVVWALAAAALACAGLALGPNVFVQGKSFWLYGLAFPAVLEFTLITAILVGKERFLALNIAIVCQTTILTAGALALWIGHQMTIFAILALWTASYAVASLLALAAIGRRQLSLRRALRPDLAVLGRQLRFGLPGQAGNILTRLNYRLDQYLVRAFRGRADVGIYAVATGLAEAVWWIANAVSTALMPRLTRIGAERAGEVAPVACRNTLLISLLAGLGLAASAPLAVTILFGVAFEGAVEPILWLLPGIVALSGTKVLASYFFSLAQLSIVSLIALLSLVTTVTLDILLIPRFGISGAAAASSVAYTVSFVAALYFYRRLSGNSPWLCVIPNPADAELYRDAARRLWRPKARPAPGLEDLGASG